MHDTRRRRQRGKVRNNTYVRYVHTTSLAFSLKARHCVIHPFPSPPSDDRCCRKFHSSPHFPFPAFFLASSNPSPVSPSPRWEGRRRESEMMRKGKEEKRMGPNQRGGGNNLAEKMGYAERNNSGYIRMGRGVIWDIDAARPEYRLSALLPCFLSSRDY